MKKNHIGTIFLIENIAKDTYKIVIKSQLDNATVGQFISILIPNKTMRRPFSITDFTKYEDYSLTTVLFKKVGDGTKYISSLKKGDKIEFLAPLGNGFKIDNKKSLLVGAGIGIAPLLFLKKELNKKNIQNYLISGFKMEEETIQGSDRTIVGGYITDYIEEIIKKDNIQIIYSCGPSIVLRKISEIGKKYNIKTQIAMEKIMACSIGVCRGCVISLKSDNQVINASICKDGPVFDGDSILWE